jgi:predicted flap endonuclease-1-like 5' DNA nuclease
MMDRAGATVESTTEVSQDMGAAATSFAMGVSDADLTGNVDSSDPEEMAKFKHPLEYVEGIGPAYGEKLKAIGLVTCLDLLKSGATRKGREDIAEKSGISGRLILEWVNHVDLYRIKGVGSEYADLLEDAGVDTVVELAQRNAANLFEKMGEVNAQKELVRKMPTTAQVEDWVAQAKGLPRVVAY